MLNLMVNKIFVKTTPFLILLIVVLLNSCSKNKFVSEKELMAFIQDESNGYKQQKTINGVNFSLLYRPTDLLVKQELGDSISEIKIQELRDKYNKYLYFNLNMSKNNQELLSTAPKNRNEFGQMVNQLAFGMREKVHVFTQAKDTLEMVDFVYPRMYGMSRSTSIMFVYPRNKEILQGNFLNFSVEDLGLNTGEVKFKIDTKNIKNQPQLSFIN